jgi:hypothetical protein
MASGILVTVKSNHPIVYLIGIILFLTLGVVLAILGFTGVIPGGGGTGAGVVGIVLAVGALILLIEYLVTR